MARSLAPEIAGRIAAGVQKAQAGRLAFDRAVADFREFLRHWSFVDRESGRVRTFDPETLWPGQERLIEAMLAHRQLVSVKAGKLGFSQLETAFTVWRVFSQPNARATVFSKDLAASFALVDYIRFGLLRLPESWNVTLRGDLAGGDSASSLKFTSRYWQADDLRTVVSVAATSSGAIDQSNVHISLDEIAHYQDPEAVYNSAATTRTPDGTIHLLSRGAGPGWFADTFEAAREGQAGDLRALFVNWQGRPDHTPEWYAQQAATLSGPGLRRYAPEVAEDALAGDDVALFCQPEWWDSCEESMPPLGPNEPVVLGVDAAYASDTFAIVGTTRHPERRADVAVRIVRVLDPRLSAGQLDLAAAEEVIRELCAKYRVVQLAFDPYQMKLMADRLAKDRVCWVKPFDQGADRLRADRQLFDLILTKRIAHDGDVRLREHILNAGARTTKDGSSLRLEKLHPQKKIDLAVATSMSASRCLYLSLGGQNILPLVG